VARLLNITWQPLVLPIVSADGYDASRLSLTAHVKEVVAGSDRPVWVHIHGSQDDAEAVEKANKKMFGKDELAIASLYFDCYAIEASELGSEERREFAKSVPSFLVFGSDGNLIAKTHGQAPATSLMTFLVKSYREVYGESLPPRIARFEEHLTRLERAEDKVAVVQKKVTDLLARQEQGDAKDAARVAEAQKELAEAQAGVAEVMKERTALLAPPKREDSAKR
jgi:hypothetical protein